MDATTGPPGAAYRVTVLGAEPSVLRALSAVRDERAVAARFGRPMSGIAAQASSMMPPSGPVAAKGPVCAQPVPIRDGLGR